MQSLPCVGNTEANEFINATAHTKLPDPNFQAFLPYKFISKNNNDTECTFQALEAYLSYSR